MSKTHKTNSRKNSNFNPVGTMPKDKLSRFKLNGNLENPAEYNHRSMSDVKVVARHMRALHTYRMLVHKCTEPRLPSSLKQSVHYFLSHMSRSDSDNARDRNMNTLNSVSVPATTTTNDSVEG